MKITDVKVFPVDEDKLKAYATITFDNCFIVRDLKVISGNKGYFIAMPSKKRKDGTFRDVAHPLNSETRKMIEDSVLEVYEKENVTEQASTPFHEDDAVVAAGDPTDPEGDVVDEDLALDEAEAVDLEEEVPEAEPAQAIEDEAEVENTVEGEDTGIAAEAIDEEAAAQDTEPVKADQPEEAEEKGAEENPVVEGSDDPEKAFGYEE